MTSSKPHNGINFKVILRPRRFSMKPTGCVRTLIGSLKVILWNARGGRSITDIHACNASMIAFDHPGTHDRSWMYRSGVKMNATVSANTIHIYSWRVYHLLVTKVSQFNNRWGFTKDFNQNFRFSYQLYHRPIAAYSCHALTSEAFSAHPKAFKKPHWTSQDTQIRKMVLIVSTIVCKNNTK